MAEAGYREYEVRTSDRSSSFRTGNPVSGELHWGGWGLKAPEATLCAAPCRTAPPAALCRAHELARELMRVRARGCAQVTLAQQENALRSAAGMIPRSGCCAQCKTLLADRNHADYDDAATGDADDGSSESESGGVLSLRARL